MKILNIVLICLVSFLFVVKAQAQEGDSGPRKSFFVTAGVDYSVGEPVDIETESGKGISAGFIMAAPRSWGFRSFLTYEFERDVEHVGGFFGFFSTPVSGDKVQFHVLQADALYRFRNAFYIPFGLSYVYADYKSAHPAREVDFSGGFGTQGGVGWLINDLINIEILTRMTIMKAKITDNSGGTGYASTGGSMFGVVFRFGIAF